MKASVLLRLETMSKRIKKLDEVLRLFFNE